MTACGRILAKCWSLHICRWWQKCQNSLTVEKNWISFCWSPYFRELTGEGKPGTCCPSFETFEERIQRGLGQARKLVRVTPQHTHTTNPWSWCVSVFLARKLGQQQTACQPSFTTEQFVETLFHPNYIGIIFCATTSSLYIQTSTASRVQFLSCN